MQKDLVFEDTIGNNWFGIYDSKPFTMLINDLEYILIDGEITDEEFEDITLRHYYDEYEYIDREV